jgi:hypothetical protein
VRTAEGTELISQVSGSAASALSVDALVEVHIDATGLLVAAE